MTDIVPRRLDLGHVRLDRQLGRQSVQHRRFVPAQSPCPGWISYASQRHVRDLAADQERGLLWLATWGGVLCWDPAEGMVTRHTSEDGLVGNATRTILVDHAGIVWATSHEGGLSTLSPDGSAAWMRQEGPRGWKVLRLAPRPGTGVYLGLRGADGRGALGEIAVLGAPMRLLAQGGLACRAIDALVVDADGTIWIGNAWGAHRYLGDGGFESFDLEGAQVRALAVDPRGGLWAGTNHGLYHLRIAPGSAATRGERWPHDEVVDIALSANGQLWAVTSTEIGRMVDSTWNAIENSPPGQLSALVALTGTSGRVWVGGANGLYEVEEDQCMPAFAPALEDGLSNAVQCLWAESSAVWIGTARGLHQFSNQTWRSYDSDAPDLRDIRAIVAGQPPGRLWVGGWRGGLHRLEQGFYIPSRELAEPIVALVAGDDGTYWAATPDMVYRLPPGSQKWVPIETLRTRIRTGAIQALCYQRADRATLWIGTSSGLFYYWPELELGDYVPAELEQGSIQALALDPHTNRLWVGMPLGLFSEHAWQCHRAVDVRALLFDPEQGHLWVGTSAGLERWPAPGQGEVFAGEHRCFDAATSGLAANVVTALAIRSVGAERELWVGSPMGISCYRWRAE